MEQAPPPRTKYCHACAAAIDSQAPVCPSCGTQQHGPAAPYPGQQNPEQPSPGQYPNQPYPGQYPNQPYPGPYPHQPYPGPYPPPVDPAFQQAIGNKMAAGLCGILIGALGVHKFLLGFTNAGIVMLLVSLLTCGFGAIPMGIIGLIEGIMYLTKSDQEFYQIYVVQKKDWF